MAGQLEFMNKTLAAVSQISAGLLGLEGGGVIGAGEQKNGELIEVGGDLEDWKNEGEE